MFFEVFDILFLTVVNTNVWETLTSFADAKATFLKVTINVRVHSR